MANTSPIFELTANNVGTQFTSADASNKKTVFTAGSNGSRVDSISLCSNDTAAINLAVYFTIGGTDYYQGNINVPIGSGYTTVVKVEGLLTIAAQLGYIFLPASAVMKVNCVATMTAAKTLDVVVQGGDY